MGYGGLPITPEEIGRLTFEEIARLTELMQQQKQKELDQIEAQRRNPGT